MRAMNANARPHVLIVDDDLRLRELLVRYLDQQGFDAFVAGDGRELDQQLKRHHADLIVLDLMLPGEDGLAICRRLRGQGVETPIIMLTAKGDEVDRIVGLEIGADDYLPKPGSPRELVARMRAVLRRAQHSAAPSSAAATLAPSRRVAFGACHLDLDERRLFGAGGEEIDISAAEFDLLALFARHPNRPLNRDQIMEQAHNRGWDVFDRSIDLRVMRLRRKIERNPDKPEVLKTVRNVGYVFVPTSAPTPAASRGGAT